MPYKNPEDRKIDNTYQSQPAQIKKRVERNKARRHALKAGLVHKGDGMDIDHIEPLSKGGSNTKSNLRVVPDNQNRSFSRNPDHSVKRNAPKKGVKK